MKCAVRFCNNYRQKNGSRTFFRFPSDARLSKIWQEFCQQTKEFKTKHACICMDHFNINCVENELKFNMGYATNRKLKHGSVPTIFSPEAASEPSEPCDTGTCDEDEDMQIDATTFSISDAQPQDFGYDLSEPLIDMLPGTSIIETNNFQKKIELLNKKIRLLRRTQRNFFKDVCKLKESSAQVRRKLENDLRTMEERFRRIEYAKENMECRLRTIFTQSQVKKIQNSVKRPKWTEEEIAQSITLYATSAKAYKLLYKKGFPLPVVRTLQERANRIHISSGIIEPVLQVLSASTQMSSIQKLCVLSFGEMKIQRSYSYCTSSDSTLAPANYAQVALLRGLMSKWEQPIFYDFDCKMTVDLLKYILRRTSSCGYTVTAIVCDLVGSNRTLYNELEVNEHKPWFLFKNEKIFVFADVPQLLKLQRNNFLDYGFIINGKHVKADIIFELLKCTSNGLSVNHKISASHLSVSGAQRQKINIATELFSPSIAQAIKRAADLGHLNGKNWKECHQLFKVTNDWFGIMNARSSRVDKTNRCNAYGLDLDSQNGILDKMTEMVKNMRAIGKRELLPFQKGIIQCIYALKLMFSDLQSRFGIKYILTYHLNQDILEHFFGVMRAKGDLDDHPDREAFKCRFRAYVLGRNEGIKSNAVNVTVDDTTEKMSADDTPTETKSQAPLTGVIFRTIANRFEDNKGKEEQVFESLESDKLETVAGYICQQLEQETVHLTAKHGSDHTYSWVTHLSQSASFKPPAEMMYHMAELHQIFNEINADGLLITNNFIKMHINRAKHVQCTKKIKILLFRAMMYFKIGKLNKEISENIL